MIELDFQFEEHVESWSSGELMDHEYFLGAFNGMLTFRLCDMDFSGFIPIAGFTWVFRNIVLSLSANECEHDEFRDTTSEWVIKFSREGDSIVVSDWRGSASADVSQFVSAVTKHSDRVFRACCEINPALLENKYFNEWWQNRP